MRGLKGQGTMSTCQEDNFNIQNEYKQKLYTYCISPNKTHPTLHRPKDGETTRQQY